MVKDFSVDQFLTTSEAAKKLGVSPGRVRQLVVDGRLPVVRIGRDNLIRLADLELVKDRKTGRPSNQKPTKAKLSRKRAPKRRVKS